MKNFTEAQIKEFSKQAADAGRLIEIGWVGFKASAIPAHASPELLADMRLAFYSGALHLFEGWMGMLDPGADPTPADEKRLDNIDQELRRFEPELLARQTSKGRA